VAGSSGTLELRVRNTLEEPVTDVSAKLYVEDPITSGDDEAFVERLEPGQTATLTFEVGAARSAIEKPYPIQVDFRYDDADGDTLISDTYQLPVTVEVRERGSGLPLPLVGAGVALLAVVGGVLYWRRRNGDGEGGDAAGARDGGE
jgi:uncharacterized membrane protein